MNSPILAPTVALILWSIVMLLWLIKSRVAAMVAIDGSLPEKPGRRGCDLDGILPDRAQWKSHNYNHLMEQPTLFYAICTVLALSNAGDGAALICAWIYVALRVAHSLVQATVNILSVRLGLFLVSSLVLTIMTILAAIAVGLG